ncbi:MAG TPA: hypothetical protein GX731_10815 [Clostridiales bacterium]|nr:hypothetical protein [Clostridiales bacterium]
MLYTVRPLEKIYATPKTKKDIEKEEAERNEKTEYQEIDLPSGRILTRRDGEDNIICRVNSTDMSDYLNVDYSPGKAYKK